MKPLPRPLSQVVREPDVQRSVARTWARLERTRTTPRSWRPFVLAPLAVAAAALVWVTTRPEPETPRGPVAAVAVAPAPAAPPAPTEGALESAMVQGRAKRLERPQEDAQLEEVLPEDPVRSLLEGAISAYVSGDPRLATALLSEAVEHHPDHPQIGEALVTLGWLQLEHLHEPTEAAKTLERALAQPLSQQLFDRAWPLLERARAERR